MLKRQNELWMFPKIMSKQQKKGAIDMNEKKTCKIEISQSYVSFVAKNRQDETMIFWVGQKYYPKVKEAIEISQKLRKNNSDQVKELTFQ